MESKAAFHLAEAEHGKAKAFDWGGDEGARYSASHLRAGYRAGQRSDVDYARKCEREYIALIASHPHLEAEFRSKWNAMRPTRPLPSPQGRAGE